MRTLWLLCLSGAPVWEQSLVWSWGTLRWPLRVCAGYSEFRSYKELVNAVPHTVPHPTTQEVTVQARAGKSSPPVWQGQAVSPLARVMVLSVSVRAQHPGHGCQVSQSCCNTVCVLPGEKPPLLVLHPKEPCRDRAASGARRALQERCSPGHCGGQTNSAVGGTDPKGAHRT